MNGEEFCHYMFDHAGVACRPGSFFWEGFSEYVRFCYASSDADIKEACERMGEVLRRMTRAGA